MYKTILLLFVILHGCKQKLVHEVVPSGYERGIDPQKLSLIYSGPKGMKLDYFPEKTIQNAKVKECKVFFTDSTNSFLARKALFDTRGKLVRDEYNYFQMEEGTVPYGIVLSRYDLQKHTVTTEGKREKEKIDSFRTISIYDHRGWLISEDHYNYSRKRKPNINSDIITENDLEKIPTWFVEYSKKYFQRGDTIVVQTEVDNKISEQKKCILAFDSTGRLSKIETKNNYQDFEVITYTYSENTIKENWFFKNNAGSKFRHSEKVILDKSGKQIEKKYFDENGNLTSKRKVFYNSNGTIKSENKWYVQKFEYTYY